MSVLAPPLANLAEAPEKAVIARRAQLAQARHAAAAAACKAVVALAVVVAVFSCLFGLAVVQGSGMQPTSGDGDLALTFRMPGQLAANDVVAYCDQSGNQLVGRVVALPGNTVEVTAEGVLRVNGTAQPSTTGETTQPVQGGPAYPLVLGEDEYFILGDSRLRATDSRTVGPVGINEVEGKVIALLRLRGI